MNHIRWSFSGSKLVALALLIQYTSSVQAVQSASVLDYEGQYQYECASIQLIHYIIPGKVEATVACDTSLDQMHESVVQACFDSNFPPSQCDSLRSQFENGDAEPLVPEQLTGINTFNLNVMFEDHPWVKRWGVYPAWFNDAEGNELFALLNNHDGVRDNVKVAWALQPWMYFFSPIVQLFQPTIDWKIDGSIERANNYSFTGFAHFTQIFRIFGIPLGIEVKVNFSGARI